jgi:hypothetical protein
MPPNASPGEGSEDSRARPRPTRRSLALIAIGGSLAMVFATGTGSPATTDYFRSLGATEFHFGLLAGLPMVMICLQFFGALAANRAARRKGVFMALLIACRLVYLPIAFLPMVWTPAESGTLVRVLIALMVLSAGMHNYAIPFWFAWMGDVVPQPVLNRFWGTRQRAMHITWTASYLAVTAFLYLVSWPPRVTFPILVVLAVVAGVVDILLFRWVHEPEAASVEGRGRLDVLLEPLRHRHYGYFVLFSCYWSWSTSFAASFMQLYVLKELRVPAWQAALIWCLAGIGVASVARRWGVAADRHGHRPLINITVTIKSFIVIVFLLLTPRNVVWLLPVSFLLDGMLNSGYMVASNGYMLTISPRANRSAFVACITGLSGICGGLAAMAAGTILRNLEGWSFDAFGRSWGRYHVIFASSLLMRLVAIPLARRIREPESSHSMVVLSEVLGKAPARFLRLPIDLYRRWTDGPPEGPVRGGG